MTDTPEVYRILIVDDDYRQAEMVMEFLRISGFNSIDHASSIRALWERLDSGRYDMVLMDYKLPDGTGIDGLNGIKTRGYQVPVVMVTGQGDERVAVQAIQLGATDYLLKSGDYLVTMPALIRKTVRAFQLQLSVQRSLEQIRYQATLLNNVRDAIVVWDMDGLITYWNPAAAALFGWSAEDRLGKPVAEVYLSIFTPPIVLPKEGDTIGQHVIRQYQARNKKTVWVSSRITTLRDTGPGSQFIGYMDVSHDITQRMEAEQALRAERNFVSAVLDTVGALVVVLDREGRIVRFNRACEQITGYTFTEVRGRFFWDLFLLPEEIDMVRVEFTRLQEGKFPGHLDNYWRTRDGRHRLITWANTGLTNQQGQVEFIIATGIDITERWQAENALRRRMQAEQLLASISTEFITLLPEQIDQGINRALEAIGKFVVADRSYVMCLSDDGSNTNNTHGWSAAGDGSPAQFMQSMPIETMPWSMQKLRHQEILYVSRLDQLPAEAAADKQVLQSQGIQSMVAVPMAYGSALLGFLGFDAIHAERTWDEQDISLLKTAAEIIVNALQRKRWAAEIRAAQTQLTQAARLATIGEMASGVAHQINNPLTTIIADAQLLLRELPASHPSRDSAEAIEQAGWRLQEVVQRLLEFSRPSGATLEPVSINQTVKQAVRLIGAHIEASGVSLEVDLVEDLPQVLGNSRQLEDLWVNLLLLARDATAELTGRTIWITTRPCNGALTVEVCDNGQPIPADQLASIFEPNFVGATSGRGTGMELSICREIVRQHEGQISAESTPEGVTIFHVTFNLIREPNHD